MRSHAVAGMCLPFFITPVGRLMPVTVPHTPAPVTSPSDSTDSHSAAHTGVVRTDERGPYVIVIDLACAHASLKPMA